MEEAVTRLKLAAEAGADVCFIEGVKTAELLKSTVASLAPTPVRFYFDVMASQNTDTMIGRFL